MDFPEHKGALRLTHNEHKNYYQTVEEWCRDNEGDGCVFEWVSPAERAAAIRNDSVWVLQWYPDTPVGFCALAASTLHSVLMHANFTDDEAERA